MADKMKVEIRWKDPLGPNDRDPFHLYLKWVERKDTPSAMEEVFKTWLADKVQGRNVIVSDLEFLVDGNLIELSEAEENSYFRRTKEAAGK
ncbi:MAG TPA: hypothetical protein VMS79_03250 [Methanomassiliicoccales archaeon]|nr:hypothetical protein [Methanomassiliicoccales archaeon]